MSDVSESPDVGDVQLGSNSAVPITREDVTLARIDALKIYSTFILLYLVIHEIIVHHF
jgi:hypothetical protein